MTFETITHKADLCVVGGGVSGICAAIAAARKGLSVALMHDRPMLGGNTSSEIRMWICGVQGGNLRETGILEELALENLRINPRKTFPMWDAVLFGAVKAEKNIKLFLNCSCLDGVCEDNRIKSITGWQLTTQLFHKIEADYFADCSGDSVLAPISGAKFRYGREARGEFEESMGLEEADQRTMGASTLLQARETNRPSGFTPPSWAKRFDEKSINNRIPNLDNYYENFWYIELGGDKTIEDTESVRDELLQTAYGVWDYVKNNVPGNDNFELDWVGYLPGKRESRRCVGDYILTQNDLENGLSDTEDIVAYGGWPIDDHPPEGFYASSPPNRSAKTAMPYGIPYRCLYSVNVDNLFFAGRNISASHIALSSTRVMGTCATMGQAIGVAASLAVRHGLTPREVGKEKIAELRNTLMKDDCYIPFARMEIGDITAGATLRGSALEDIENLRNGLDRDTDSENGWVCEKDGWFEYKFASPTQIENLRLVFDSSLNRGFVKEQPPSHLSLEQWKQLSRVEYRHSTKANSLLSEHEVSLPGSLVKSFTVTAELEDGLEVTLYRTDNNARRLVNVEIGTKVKSLRITLHETHGFYPIYVFSATLD